MLAAAAAVLVVAVMAGGAAAQTSPSSTSGCTQTLIGMSPCLNYITVNETSPSSSCCSQLGTVVRSQPECLCVALNADPAALGLGNVNRTRALGLPDQCNVKTPSLSNCNSKHEKNWFFWLNRSIHDSPMVSERNHSGKKIVRLIDGERCRCCCSEDVAVVRVDAGLRRRR